MFYNSELEQGFSTNDLICKGILEFDDEIQKAVYADTYENRKLGRVGQEYTRKKANGGEPEKISTTGRIQEQNVAAVNKREPVERIKESTEWIKEQKRKGIFEQKRQELIDNLSEDFYRQFDEHALEYDDYDSGYITIDIEAVDEDYEDGYCYAGTIGISYYADYDPGDYWHEPWCEVTYTDIDIDLSDNDGEDSLNIKEELKEKIRGLLR